MPSADEAGLYFAFPDGVFHHVCAECTMNCCRSGGACTGNARREMPELLARFPAMAAMAVGRQGDIVSFVIPRGGCLLLDGDGLCRAQKEYSKDLKPEGCVLFPFNDLGILGPYVTVRPHFLCPLRLAVPPRPGEVEGTHALLRPTVERSAQVHLLRQTTKAARWGHLPESPELTIRREEAFRDLCTSGLGRRRFHATLEGASADARALRKLVQRGASFLRLPPSHSRQHDDFDDLLHALAPSWRVDTLHLDAETRLVALALYELALRQTGSLCQTPLSVQRAFTMVSAVASAVRLVSRGDVPLPSIRGPINKGVPAFLDGEMTLAAYKMLLGIGTERGTLDVLEDAMQKISSTSDRIAVLTGVSNMLEGRTDRRKRPTSSTVRKEIG